MRGCFVRYTASWLDQTLSPVQSGPGLSRRPTQASCHTRSAQHRSFCCATLKVLRTASDFFLDRHRNPGSDPKWGRSRLGWLVQGRRARANAARIVRKSAEVKVPTFAGQGPGWTWPFLGGRPRRRGTGADSGGVMIAFEHMCSGMSSATFGAAVAGVGIAETNDHPCFMRTRGA